MSNTLIQAENISKYYRLGTLGSGSLKEDIRNWLSGKKSAGPAVHANHVWALKDINFEVKKGEALGFIGKNGAGKSTLLKIISRITLPTTGRVRGKGRIASLLEVGTGFHGELTGRENIYLNGSILGMYKKEIDRKFDEIVDFSGVEKFLDTPVKRYSSGMYVRLAFAVAANLDPEILIVDEVLAVGDSEFQKKSIGKMREVSTQEGKTILFVSHNMQAIKNLCDRAIILEKGHIINSGDPESIIASYLKDGQSDSFGNEFGPEYYPGNEYIRILNVSLTPQYLPGQQMIDIRTPLLIRFTFRYLVQEPGDLMMGVHLFNLGGECIFDLPSKRYNLQSGVVEGECLIPGNILNDGSYYINIVFVRNSVMKLFDFNSCLSFDVQDFRENIAWFGKWQGYVRPDFPVLLKQLETD
jgi:lipopolysaccharide transport system ATP-binding protein